MWHVPTGALNGTIDAIFNWYYGHNVLGFWFTTMGVPAFYYFIVKIIGKPLYSHLLSLITFFTLAFFYTGVGAHHLLQAPLPPWLKNYRCNNVYFNGGAHHCLYYQYFINHAWFMEQSVSTTLRFGFIVFGVLAYVLVSFQGSFQGFTIH